MAVTRCICYRRTFAELKALAVTNGWTTVGEISLETSCGLGCGSCRIYLEAMLDTGATSFAVCEAGVRPRPAAPDPWDVAS